MMTQKDFEAVAETLNYTGTTTHNWQAVSLIANDLADTFATINPRFDRDRFLVACGVQSPKGR